MRKKLVITNSLIDAMKHIFKMIKKENGLGLRIHNLNKYKCGVFMSKSLGVSRKRINRNGSRFKAVKQRLQAMVQKIGRTERKMFKAKKVLSDYLHKSYLICLN